MLTRTRNNRRGFTAVELVVVLIVLAILVTVTLVQVDKRRQAMLREQSAQNLRMLWKTYEIGVPWFVDSGPMTVLPAVSVSQWPRLSSTPGQLALDSFHRPAWTRDEDGKILIEQFLQSNNQTAFISPAHPDAERMRQRALDEPKSALTDGSYWFPGYGMPDEEAGLAFVAAYRKAIEETGKPPSGPIDLEGEIVFSTPRVDVTIWSFEGLIVFSKPRGDVTISRLLPLTNSYAVYAFFPNQEGGVTIGHVLPIPILIERPGLQRGGSNVLWGDGTVEFIPYPGKWPMTKRFIKALESLDALKVKE